MREIEFRGKDKSTGKWVYGDLTHTMGVTYTGLRPRVMVGGYEVYEDSVGQSTNLKDINGNYIYSGDILMSRTEKSDGEIIGYVKDGVRGYCYDVVYTHPKEEKSWSLYGVFKDDYESRIEVVGNVFDNKELLK
jgi:uncharacterized phage protein (TIGR01671 family)